MGKLNNYAGLFSLAVLALLLYGMFANRNNNDEEKSGNFLGYSLRRKRK